MNVANGASGVRHNLDNNLLHPEQNHDIICISRKDLETEHSILLARIHQVRRILGLTPLETGKQQRKAQRQA